MEWLPYINKEYLTYIHDTHFLFDLESKYSHDDIHALMIRSRVHVTKELLDTFPSVRAIFRIGVGLDHIDMNECKKRDIKVYNTPWANAKAVADLAIRWTLTLLRNWHTAYSSMKLWKLPDRFSLLWRELNSLRVHFVWLGRIWKEIYSRLKGFGVERYWYYDPYIASLDWFSRFDSVKDCLETADIVYCCLPLTEETKHIINMDTLSHANNALITVNTSRWWIVHESDMRRFLSEHPDAWYYADVWEDEPVLSEAINNLMTLDNVLVTPHMWSMSEEAQRSMHYFDILTK